MKYRYLTIEREYGSGGTEIGRRLSEKLGIPCFGREILEEVSKERRASNIVRKPLQTACYIPYI